MATGQRTKSELPREADVTAYVGCGSKLRDRDDQQDAGRHGVVSPIFVPLRGRAMHVDEAVFLAGFGLLNRIVGRFFEIHQHMSDASICWEMMPNENPGALSETFRKHCRLRSGPVRQCRRACQISQSTFKSAPIERAGSGI